MANEFYSPGAQRAAKVNDLFAAIAQRYDLINDLQSLGLHRRWKRRLVTRAGARTGLRALDLCTGTGDIALRLAEYGVNVVGVDFNSNMLAVAEGRKLKTAKAFPSRGQVEFQQGDAQNLSFPDDTFDIVTVGYGLRNLARWESGVREMLRVARPGGRILVLDFGKPENALWRQIYFAYLRLFVPVLGLIFCKNSRAYAYILESLKHFPAQRGIESEMRQLGMINVRVENILGGAMSINYGEKPSG